MSTVNAKNLECDSIVAQNGNTAKEVSIPSLNKNMAFAKAILRRNSDVAPLTPESFSPDSFNVSSITKTSQTEYIVNLITGKDDPKFAYGVSLTGHDVVNGRFLEGFHYAPSDTANRIHLSFFTFDDTAASPTLTSADIIIF